jgi:hypothetical protein
MFYLIRVCLALCNFVVFLNIRENILLGCIYKKKKRGGGGGGVCKRYIYMYPNSKYECLLKKCTILKVEL